jgi:phage terminase large subunit-like protein
MRMCGRGEGKTRSAAEWVREEVKARRARRIILAGPTAPIVRDVMIEGESGLLAVHSNRERPRYYPSKRRVVWPNGAFALVMSSDEPELARGAQSDLLWGEEIGAWRYPVAFFDNLNLGLRLGQHPRGMLTLTPKPIKLIKRLVQQAKDQPQRVHLTRGSTFDNVANLPESTLDDLRYRYEGTRQGEQELYGKLLTDTPGAMWTWALIDDARLPEGLMPTRDKWEHVVVAVDPAVTAKAESNETGIICGFTATVNGILHAYVVRDLSGRWEATEWPKVAVRAYHLLSADRIVAEVNNGGDLVEGAVRVVDSDVSYRSVTASRGKRTRAEPVVALYEQGRVHHVGDLSILEEQMTTYVPGVSDKADEETGSTSPDRVDALVWLIFELILSRQEVRVI